MGDGGGTEETSAALDALRAAGVAHQILRYADDSIGKVGGVEAAELLGLEPRAVFKTLVVEVGGELVLVLVPVAARLDTAAVAEVIGSPRASMARPAKAEEATGYRLGAISPFGGRRFLRCVVDESALALHRIYVSGGRHGLEIGVATHDLLALTAAVTAPVAQWPEAAAP
jgi:Cys-tRNA(Pro)/Cys-tRNA(Cys) deacylase